MNIKQVKDYIRQNQRATISEIRDSFDMKQGNCMYIIDDKIIGYDMPEYFFKLLQQVIKEDDVVVEHDPFCSLISDSEYLRDHRFHPIVLSVKSKS